MAFMSLPTRTFDEISAASYVLLTTFTKDGRAKPSAVWAAREGDELLVWTVTDSWKVRRIRNTPRVTLAVCDRRGKPLSEAIDATARVLDDTGTKTTRDAVSRKYGLIGWVLVRGSALFRGEKGTIGLAITA